MSRMVIVTMWMSIVGAILALVAVILLAIDVSTQRRSATAATHASAETLHHNQNDTDTKAPVST